MTEIQNSKLNTKRRIESEYAKNLASVIGNWNLNFICNLVLEKLES
jgi:hypothetical protein